MSLDLGIEFNETIEAMVCARLRASNSTFELMTDEGIVRKCSKTRIMGALAMVAGVTAFSKIGDLVDIESVGNHDPAFLSRGLFIPLKREENQVLIAVANPWDYRADDYCASKFPDHEVVKILCLSSEISSVIERSVMSAGPNREELDAVEVEEFTGENIDFDVTREYEEPIAQLVATMVSDAIKQHASDIHIKTEKTSFHYAFRVDGDIGKKTEMPVKLKDRLDAFLLNLMRVAPEERSRRPGISGRFSAIYYGRTVGMRFERHRTYRGYHVTMRLLDKANIEARLGMGTLAFDKDTLFELEKAMSVPSGILVMSGPTGSGKSTTLNAMLRELNRPEENILTLENPVEDEIPGVTHCDLKDSSEFKPMITSFMRSDPDIILMGEVRDTDSAELAIEAAITGHKVLTTIHTPQASQIIERFQQLGIERWKISQTLKAACAQRLVKLVCPSCKEKVETITPHELKLFNLSDEWAGRPVYRHRKDGCKECRYTGYSGRTAILEILPISFKVGDALSKGEITPYELEMLVRRETNLPSLKDNGLKLLAEGRSDLEALRKCIDMSH
jgi:type IV pilus assembly protein PilB